MSLATERGLDPAAVVAAAEARGTGTPDAPAHPVADRMLIGFLPFVTVREFRSLWLGLDERVPDDGMVTGEWLGIYGDLRGGAEGDTEGDA